MLDRLKRRLYLRKLDRMQSRYWEAAQLEYHWRRLKASLEETREIAVQKGFTKIAALSEQALAKMEKP